MNWIIKTDFVDIVKILSYILDIGQGEKYYRIANADGKVWLMPAHNMRRGMNLYQPSGRKGKLLKFWFPVLKSLSPIRRKIGADELKCKLNKDLQELLCNLFGETELQFSVFCGTPCAHQKITLQLSVGKRILGYCKITDSKEIVGLFENEVNVLSYLLGKSICNVPICFFCGEWKKDLHLFVQSTTKTNRSTTDHQWGIREEHFIIKLYENSKSLILFEYSDFFKDIHFLQSQQDRIKRNLNAEVVEPAVQLVLDYYGNSEVTFSVYHADFTPWNIYVEKNELFVFDFEYAKYTYPPFLDYFHFFLQTAIFEKHRDVKEIISDFENMEFCHGDKDFLFLCYLLAILSNYLQREKGALEGSVAYSIILWIQLINYLINKIS